MFVSDSTLFSPVSMKLRVCGMNGTDLILEVNPDASVDKVKSVAVGGIADSSDHHHHNAIYFRLVNVRTGKALTEETTMAKEDVQDNDELLLVRKRMPPPGTVDPSASKKDDSKTGPTLEQIKKATENVPAKNHDREESVAADAVDFQSELKKILVTLIEAAEKILCLNPEAAKIFKDAEHMTQEEARPPPPPISPKVDESALQQLLDMGFPEQRAVKALHINKMSATEAIQWLLEHDNDADIDVPLPQMSPSRSPSPAKPNTDVDKKSPSHFNNLLRSFKAIRRKQFKPNQRILSNLVEMGFEVKDAIDALRIAGNKEIDACDWLLAGRTQEEVYDPEVGLDPESSLCKAILSNPIVQLGLSNPKNLNALFHMYENMDSTKQWLNDPDTGPMLIQISRIYHAEKHSQSSSRPSTSRQSSGARS